MTQGDAAMPRYTLPNLEGHKVAYRGRRFWVIEVDEQHPFDWVKTNLGRYAIYDMAGGMTIASASEAPGGRYICTYPLGQGELHCHANTVSEMGRVVDAEYRKYS